LLVVPTIGVTKKGGFMPNPYKGEIDKIKWLQKIGTISLVILTLGSLGADGMPKKLNQAEINSLAKQTTVLIAPQLQPQELEDLLAKKPGKNWTFGSGVIVAKEGQTYYVLTVAHNFAQEQVEKNLPYGILTSDRQVHVVQSINDGQNCTNNFQVDNRLGTTALLRFGCYQSKRKVNGYDLAIVTFESSLNYAIAPIGATKELNTGELLYVSGWPNIEVEAKLNNDGSPQLDAQGRIICQDPSPRRQRQLTWGPLQAVISASAAQNGYSLYYIDRTRPGMSGGPVFNESGQVVGIHGRGSENKLECGQVYQPPTKQKSNSGMSGMSKNDGIFDPDGNWDNPNPDNSENDNSPDANQQNPRPNNQGDRPNSQQSNPPTNPANSNNLQAFYSSAQNIDYARQLISQAGVRLSLNLASPSGELIQAGISEIPLNRSTLESEGSFEDPNDVIENIYKTFSFDIQNMLRDKPSDGGGILLD
jgi:hypothetical protein